MLSDAAMTHRVAIVGAGPAGFYAADGLLRGQPDLRIDLIDRLPTPFGLVRAGVAPDHQGTKAVVRQFERLLAQPDVRFAGKGGRAPSFPGEKSKNGMGGGFAPPGLGHRRNPGGGGGG